MANLVRLLHLSKLNNSLPKSLVFSAVLNRTKSSKSTPPDDSPNIEIIHKNEETYFTEVKKSFDGLNSKRKNETLEQKRSRLLYQSRKRGTSENGLLLSNFSARFLQGMSEKELNEFDKIINELHNEWDLYYWLTDAASVPKELQSNQVLKQMKEFCKNEHRESRVMQPDIHNILQ